MVRHFGSEFIIFEVDRIDHNTIVGRSLEFYVFTSMKPCILAGLQLFISNVCFFMLRAILCNMTMFDGKFHSRLLDEQIKFFLKSESGKRYLRGESALAIVIVGQDPASLKYISLKEKYCERLGLKVDIIVIPESETDNSIYTKIKDIFSNPRIGGGIIQLPLPRNSLKNVLNLIPKNKDVDLLSEQSLSAYYSGDYTRMSPVVRAFNYFVDTSDLSMFNARVGLIGCGELVGKPILRLLLEKGAHIDVYDDNIDPITLLPFGDFSEDGISLKTNYRQGEELNYDILILTTPLPNLVKGENISSNCVVADFGSSVVNDKTVGNLDLTSDLSHLKLVSPSPGGLGPLVIRYLIMNFLGI